MKYSSTLPLGIVEALVGSCIVWWGVLGVGMLMGGCGGGLVDTGLV